MYWLAALGIHRRCVNIYQCKVLRRCIEANFTVTYQRQLLKITQDKFSHMIWKTLKCHPSRYTNSSNSYCWYSPDPVGFSRKLTEISSLNNMFVKCFYLEAMSKFKVLTFTFTSRCKTHTSVKQCHIYTSPKPSLLSGHQSKQPLL